MKTRLLAAGAIAAVSLGAPSFGTFAQEKYPSRPVQVLVPVSSGTTADIVARMYTDRLSQRLGQQFVVLNRQGAGGTIATQALAKAAPDGYTVMLANSQHSVNPGLLDNLPYDSARDFSGVALVGEAPTLIVVSPKVGAKTLKEFIAIAKQKPGALNYASAGIGSATHMAGAYFASSAGIQLVHVPYKSSSDIIADMLAGRIEAVFAPTAFLLAQVREGKLLGLGISSPQGIRSPIEVPSVSEAAIPGYEYATWYGFIASSKAPVQVLEPLSRAIREISEEKDVKDKYASQGINPRVITLREFDAYIKADMDKLAPIIKAVGAKAN